MEFVENSTERRSIDRYVYSFNHPLNPSRAPSGAACEYSIELGKGKSKLVVDGKKNRPE
jgi:hypothetical protein